MQRAIISSLGLLVACGTAYAQSLTIYGVVDAAVEHVTNVGASGDSLTRMPSLTGGSVPSRIGFRGTEDLGDGLRAVFTLEQGFAPDSGVLNQGGRSFGRQAFVGSCPWGSLTAGRQYTMLFWSLLETDILGPANFGAGSLDSYIPNARADNALAYRGTFNGFTVGATYSLGRDVVNAGPSLAGTNCAGESSSDSKACREWSALLKYDSQNWGAALAVDELRGGPGAFAGLSSSAMKDTRTIANAYVKFGALKLAGGLLKRDNEGSATTPRSDLWYAGAAYPVGLWTFDAELFRLKFKGSDNAANMVGSASHVQPVQAHGRLRDARAHREQGCSCTVGERRATGKQSTARRRPRPG